jgi:hypothetical protein
MEAVEDSGGDSTGELKDRKKLGCSYRYFLSEMGPGVAGAVTSQLN